jgi:hypothetical protein
MRCTHRGRAGKKNSRRQKNVRISPQATNRGFRPSADPTSFARFRIRTVGVVQRPCVARTTAPRPRTKVRVCKFTYVGCWGAAGVLFVCTYVGEPSHGLQWWHVAERPRGPNPRCWWLKWRLSSALRAPSQSSHILEYLRFYAIVHITILVA